MDQQVKGCNMDWQGFAVLLAKYAKADAVFDGDVLFRSGLDLSSIGFTEFIMELEEETGLDIDLDSLDASIVTAGQLYARILG
jgi:acyl carrier protein